MARTHRVLTAIGLAAALAAGCDSDRHGRSEGKSGSATEGSATTLTIKGSDTMVILAQKWAEAFMNNHPETTLQVSGGGSGTGIAALINGTTDLANASRKMKESEKRQLKQRRGAEAVRTSVAIDAIAVYVHKDNPVESITVPELAKAYRAAITSWKELDGEDQEIVLYGRQSNSGTYAYFKEQVLGGRDFAARTQAMAGTAAVINAVTKDTGGLGYGGIGYAEGVKTLPLAPEKDAEPVEPTKENATGGDYPLARHLYIYTAGEPKGLAQRYIDFVRSDEGQKLVENVGYYPLKASNASGETSSAKAPSSTAE